MESSIHKGIHRLFGNGHSDKEGSGREVQRRRERIDLSGLGRIESAYYIIRMHKGGLDAIRKKKSENLESPA
jgi:hypothetical protein